MENQKRWGLGMALIAMVTVIAEIYFVAGLLVC